MAGCSVQDIYYPAPSQVAGARKRDGSRAFIVISRPNATYGQLPLPPADPAEVRAARFVERATLDRLPENERSVLRSLAYYRQYGTIRLR